MITFIEALNATAPPMPARPGGPGPPGLPIDNGLIILFIIAIIYGIFILKRTGNFKLTKTKPFLK